MTKKTKTLDLVLFDNGHNTRIEGSEVILQTRLAGRPGDWVSYNYDQLGNLIDALKTQRAKIRPPRVKARKKP